MSSRTTDGRRLTTDLWLRCYGVVPTTDYLAAGLATARTADGRIEVDDHLRVAGQRNVFAVGDVTTYLPGMAGFAGMQAEVVAATIRAEITGTAEPAGYQPLPPAIAVPVGPNGGAGQLPGQDDIVGPDQIAEIKGRTLFVERYQELFGLARAS